MRILNTLLVGTAVTLAFSVSIPQALAQSAAGSTNPGPLSDGSFTSIPPASSGEPTAQNPPYLITDPAVQVPEPSNLDDYVADKQALLRLGKALFWDQQLGSDGIQSCASCHFNAGADSRTKNQVGPGLLAMDPASTSTNILTQKDTSFQIGSNGPNGVNHPNYQLKRSDFPLFNLADPTKPQGVSNPVTRNVNDVVSSQGVMRADYVSVTIGATGDNVTYKNDTDGFMVGSAIVRRVEPVNAPTVIDATFNRLQFWDGRAKEVFNGVNILGAADASAQVVKRGSNANIASFVSVAIPNSSLASLMTGPPLSIFEMSAEGRSLHNIGARLLSLRGKRLRPVRPLNLQQVSPSDSVLGLAGGVQYSRYPNNGLAIASYDAMIRSAFKPDWWGSNRYVEVDSNGAASIIPRPQTVAGNQFSQMEYNFSLFFGLAVQKYLSTLVSDQSPFDKYQAGDTTALTSDQIEGLRIFVKATDGTTTTAGTNGGGGCNTCHAIPEFLRGSVRRTAGTASTDAGNPLINVNANGFFTNYAVPFVVHAGAPQSPQAASSRVRAPTLRNIELTAPYMHNGGKATLEQVVDFYNRGRGDGEGAPNTTTRAALGALLGLTDLQKAQLVAFLKALTDPRVKYERAPFDHPSLKIPNGQTGTDSSVQSVYLPNAYVAMDDYVSLPAVGSAGVTAPQKTFYDNLAQ